jgi:hypothetical protein
MSLSNRNTAPSANAAMPLPVALARVEVQIARKRAQEILLQTNEALDRYVQQLLVANHRLEIDRHRSDRD